MQGREALGVTVRIQDVRFQLGRRECIPLTPRQLLGDVTSLLLSCTALTAEDQQGRARLEAEVRLLWVMCPVQVPQASVPQSRYLTIKREAAWEGRKAKLHISQGCSQRRSSSCKRRDVGEKEQKEPIIHTTGGS